MMKSNRFALAGFSGALALMTLGTARAEVVTIAPDGTVERSENAATQQQQQGATQQYGAPRRNENQQQEPAHDLATPEFEAGINGNRVAERSRTQPNNRDNRNDRDNRHDRDDRNRYRVPGRGYRGDVTIIGDVYIGGRPGYGYGYPNYGGYPVYGYPYGGNSSYDYYGNTYGNGVTITYGNGLGGYYGNGQTVIGGQTGMQPAWPNMQPANGMGNPFGNTRPQPQPRLPRAIYNQGRRR